MAGCARDMEDSRVAAHDCIAWISDPCDVGPGGYKVKHGWTITACFPCAGDDDRACRHMEPLHLEGWALRARVDGLLTFFGLRDLAGVGVLMVNLLLVP